MVNIRDLFAETGQSDKQTNKQNHKTTNPIDPPLPEGSKKTLSLLGFEPMTNVLYFISGTCTCKEDYYTENGGCFKKKLVGEGCKGGQCSQNSLCSSFFGGVCQCVQGFFEEQKQCVGGVYTLISTACENNIVIL